jgi:putative CocE/NonD family hydrolase
MGGPAVRRYVVDGRARGYPVRTEQARIPMDDGIDLAVTLYLPDAPGDGPFPALLESIPYRKDDWTLSRDWPLHGAFAAAGYASCRLDVRGTGSSRGIAADEYTEREILDNVAVVDWLANRPGASGTVGMFGISWGGFSALQAAMRRPPALKAIIPACFSHDRYHVDVHWWGGTRLIGESAYWPVEMVGENALPPDPERFGSGWREEWLRRLDATPQWPLGSLRHQRRDAHWRHGSAIEDWGSIEAATLALGGLNDLYRDSVLAVVANVRAPVRGFLGPWGHAWPHAGAPGPTIDGVGLMTRWWDRWLKDERNGIDAGPALTVFAVEPGPGAAFPTAVTPPEVPGRWWALGRWPSVLRVAPPPPLHLGGDGAAGLGTLGHAPAPAGEAPDAWTGGPAGALTAPFTCTGSEPQGGPLDQRPDDARSLLYTSGPLDEPVLVVGFPAVDLWVAADCPVAQVAVRL